MPVDLSGGTIPAVYRDLFDMLNLHGLKKLTIDVFVPLFESTTLTKNVLNQVWLATTNANTIGSRNDFYKCLAFMALAQQGKPVEEKLLSNYANRELPVPTMDSINDIENLLIRLLRSDQGKITLCFRYNELCALDTIQVEVAAEKKGVIIRHVEYEVSSSRQNNKVFRRYNDFLALHELMNTKYPFRITSSLPPKKTVNVDKEFIEERRRSLKRYLQILCRHPVIYESDIIKFFLTFQGTACGDNMKATYKNTPDEFTLEGKSTISPIDRKEKYETDYTEIRMFRASQTHMSFIHQHLLQIRACLRSIHEKNCQNAAEFENIEKTLQGLASDGTSIDRWATGANDYWPTIQVGLRDLPTEMSAVAERIHEQCKRDDEVISDHLDMLIDLLQGYRDLCKRFEESLQNEQKAIQKATFQQRQPSTTTDASPKTDPNLEMVEKRNKHALKCLQMETQLVYANLEAFVFILSGFGNSQSRGSSDLANIWQSFAKRVSQLGQDYVNKSPTQRSNTIAMRK